MTRRHYGIVAIIIAVAVAAALAVGAFLLGRTTVQDYQGVPLADQSPSTLPDACPSPERGVQPAKDPEAQPSAACVAALTPQQTSGTILPPPDVIQAASATDPNGNLPSSSLAAATGCTKGLDRQAAAAWNHVAVIAHSHGDPWFASNGDASCYRTYQQQVDLRNYWCGQGACGNAAVPGTSNHGWGLAVDAPPATVSSIHHYAGGLFGQGYGSCSDAPWESWHIKYCGGYSGSDPGPYGSGGGGGFHALKHGSKGKRVHTLQVHLFFLHDANSDTQNGYLVKWEFVTGYFGDHTKLAVKKLQHDGHLTSDGIYGQKTAEYTWNRWKHFCNHHPQRKVCS